MKILYFALLVQTFEKLQGDAAFVHLLGVAVLRIRIEHAATVSGLGRANV